MSFLANERMPYWTYLEEEIRSEPIRPMRMREANSRELLRLLHRNSPCSRADLVRWSGLAAPTVSAAIESLQRKGLVRSLGDGESSGGRPPELLEFNARHSYLVGADIGGSTVRLALADLSGKILGRWKALLGADRDPEAVVESVAQGIEYLCEQHEISAKKVIELAVGAPGITNVQTGRVLSAPNLTNWKDVPLRELLEQRTGLSCTIENDVNLAALGERWCGVAQGVRNFVFLALGTGLGAGIVINGQLHHGAQWSAGEVGYLSLPGLPSRPLKMNRLGALESVIGGKGIVSAWRQSQGARHHASSASDVFDRAVAGDSKAKQVLEATAQYLALAIVNMSLVLDISLVVIGGGIGSHQALLDATLAVLSKNEFARPQLMLSSLSGEAQLQGAVWLALRAADAHSYQPLRSKSVRQLREK
jgi:glucokinase